MKKNLIVCLCLTFSLSFLVPELHAATKAQKSKVASKVVSKFAKGKKSSLRKLMNNKNIKRNVFSSGRGQATVGGVRWTAPTRQIDETPAEATTSAPPVVACNPVRGSLLTRTNNYAYVPLGGAPGSVGLRAQTEATNECNRTNSYTFLSNDAAANCSAQSCARAVIIGLRSSYTFTEVVSYPAGGGEFRFRVSCTLDYRCSDGY